MGIDTEKPTSHYDMFHHDKLAAFDRREQALLAAMDALKWERQEYILAREWRELNKLGEFA